LQERSRIKYAEIDPDKRWVRTWNDYLQRIKYFFKWLYNQKETEAKGLDHSQLLPNQGEKKAY